MLRLHTKTFGDPGHVPLLLLHGLFGSSTNWGSVARQLADHYHVIVPDLRNHGQSPHTDVHDYPSMAGDVVALLDAHGVDSATVVGHSMGGKVAMHLALTIPQRVARLAVVDMSPVAYAHDFDNVLRGFAAVDLDAITARSDADAQMRAAVSGAGVRAFLLQNLSRVDGNWQWRVNLDALAAAQDQITGFPDYPQGTVFDRPTRFIHGELSDYVRPSHHVAIERLFPNASLCRVDGAGHWVYADRAQGFMSCLQALLDQPS
ncbi:MAG: alpha/beta fold hydrolase [Gammaproteobacteria bacterium]|nr:alpha/beta fold hydrolase [Gammaproteobacteria bacterium]